MSKYIFDIPGQQSYWGESDIVDSDLEKLEFDKVFSEPVVYNSILDEDPAYRSLMNFPEEDQDALYAEEDEDDEEPTDSHAEEDPDRESYKTVDQENMYYFI